MIALCEYNFSFGSFKSIIFSVILLVKTISTTNIGIYVLSFEC
jgi:hypothetical protein